MLIYLIGFMGAGKSFTGKRLADVLGYDFVDLDDELEKGEGKIIGQVFTEEGEAAFRKLESWYLRQTGGRHQTIIATGGGTPCHGNNLAWMRDHGLVIYLQTPVEDLVRRLLPELAHRPLIAGLDEQGLYQFIQQKLKEREPYYEAADVILIQEAQTDSVETITQQLFGQQ